MAITTRHATVEDASTVHGLIRDLAAAQDSASEMRSTVADIARDGFGPGALFHSLLAEEEGEAVGLALYFYIYSTWQGRPALYVEDLIVTDRARGRGIGTLLMRKLAGISSERGCSKLELSVSARNTARAFYEGLGMNQKGDWIPYTISGPALDRLAVASRQ
jgi:GNAT superfamily N-acetyltransferase